MLAKVRGGAPPHGQRPTTALRRLEYDPALFVIDCSLMFFAIFQDNIKC